MNIKYYISAFFLSILVIGIYYLEFIDIKDDVNANYLYKVYLNDEVIGLINDSEELYTLINNEQQQIKEEYGVDNVYPPSEFNMVKVNTYDSNTTDVNTIYNEIEKVNDFTVKGYTITIKTPEIEGAKEVEDIIINVLDKEIFDESIFKFVYAFVDDKTYQEYINNEQEEIEDTGKIIEAMYFKENISIKENYISVNEKIFLTEADLSQYLMFGSNIEMDSYTVKTGDTIASIAENNKLNTKEFLVANPDYRDETMLLEIGSKVNVTLLDPVVNLNYEVKEVAIEEIDYRNVTIYDQTKSSSYSEITTAGVTGLQKVTKQYIVTNGLESQGVEIDADSIEVLREVVDQVTTKGPQYSSGGSSGLGSGSIYTGLTFSRPVNSGAIVTSAFGVYRSGDRHNGTDYSGTGSNSPIYAIADGVVTQAAEACSGCSRWTSGTYIVISHGNNFYSSYLHMYKGSLRVGVGDYVQGGQQIGGMGSTGWSTGTHLHLGFSVGEPYVGNATYYDAHKLIYGG